LSSIVLGGREREQAARHKYRKTLRKSTRSWCQWQQFGL
jgi:hypothetical protein